MRVMICAPLLLMGSFPAYGIVRGLTVPFTLAAVSLVRRLHHGPGSAQLLTSSCSPVHTRVIAQHENQDRCLVVKSMDWGLEEPGLTFWLSTYW